jgi:uncharacterized protein (TIGR02246 family)
MKKALFFLTAVSCCAGIAQELPGTASRCSVAADEAVLLEIAEAWKNGYNTGDAAAVAALYAEDAYYLTQHFAGGILHGRARIQAYVQRGIDARYRIDTIRVLASGCAADLAYTVGRYESTNAGQKAFGVNVVVLRKFDGRWLIVAHESAVPDSTAIQQIEE